MSVFIVFMLKTNMFRESCICYKNKLHLKINMLVYLIHMNNVNLCPSF